MGIRSARLLTADDPPGVTRFDVLCRPRLVETVLDLTGRWAEDRALPANGRQRLAHLMHAAVEHGMRFEPRALSISMRWIDPERVRVDVHWFECTDAARTDGDGHDLASTIDTLDALAVDWGVGRTGDVSVQWLLADIA